MNKKLILIAGIPASGKTRYGIHISEKLNLPFFSKDHFKEKLHDVLKWDNTVRGNSKHYGTAAYSVFYHATECLMKAGVSLVVESNFVPQCEEILNRYVTQYGYLAMTVLFDAEITVLHKRFLERDETEERHPGLVSGGLIHDDFNLNKFEEGCKPMREFRVGEKITVDTTYFAELDYSAIDEMVEEFVTRVLN